MTIKEKETNDVIDMEKVIKGLETIKQFFGYGLPSTAELFDSYYGILNDAIAMLKKQEPVQVVWKLAFPYCPECGQMLPKGDRVKYCFHCGQVVKWE